jgi:hypothetical protein
MVKIGNRDDSVLPYARGLSLVIIPFLLVAFGLLYIFPNDTKRLFAWTITPSMTPMMLAAAYLGGAYFFLRALRERGWSALKTGFLAVTLFASLLGVATVIHWDKFNHQHLAFWLWAGLYFSTPFLVIGGWLANQRRAAPQLSMSPGSAPHLGGRVGLVGGLALVQGSVMFLAPTVVIPIWPWLLTPLTCRVVGAIFCLGSAGIGAFVDPRWTTVRLMIQVETLMVALILIGALRASSDFYPDRPVTWLMLIGFLVVLLGSAYLWYSMEISSRRTVPHLASA